MIVILADEMNTPLATGMIVGPNESLREIFPDGSDPKAWKKALDKVVPKNDVESIEARCASIFTILPPSLLLHSPPAIASPCPRNRTCACHICTHR